MLISNNDGSLPTQGHGSVEVIKKSIMATYTQQLSVDAILSAGKCSHADIQQ